MPKERVKASIPSSTSFSSSADASNNKSSNKSSPGAVSPSSNTGNNIVVSIPNTSDENRGVISSPVKSASSSPSGFPNEGSSTSNRFTNSALDRGSGISPTSPSSSKWGYKSKHNLSPSSSSLTSPSSPTAKKLAFTVNIIADEDNNPPEEQQSLLLHHNNKMSKPMISSGSGGSGPSAPAVVVNKHLLNVIGGGGGKDRDSSSTITSMDSTFNRNTTFSMMSSNNNENTITNTSTVDSTTFKKIRNRMSSKYGRMRKRVVFKNGDCNLHPVNISKRRRKYLADIFVTLVDLQWRWTFLIFTMSFLLSWAFFAMIYWLISFSHGDLEPQNLPENQEKSGWSPCISNFNGFTSSFLYSLETQSTIGYGFRYTTEECPDAIFVMCVQTILGVIISAVMVGVVFSKLSRPKKRTQTLMFSKYAVICQRDGSLCLMLRVGDMRKSHIICASVRAQLIKRRSTAEGEVLPFYQHELKVGVDSDQQAIFFIWPMVVVHRIDRDSPLYGMSAVDIAREKFEIVIILEGVIESTGSTTQARTSYLPSEILWGYRFEPLVSFKKELGEYAVDYSLFNSFYEVDTPLCSAEELEDLQNYEKDMKRQGLQLLTPFRVAVVDEKKGETRIKEA